MFEILANDYLLAKILNKARFTNYFYSLYYIMYSDCEAVQSKFRTGHFHINIYQRLKKSYTISCHYSIYYKTENYPLTLYNFPRKNISRYAYQSLFAHSIFFSFLLYAIRIYSYLSSFRKRKGTKESFLRFIYK